MYNQSLIIGDMMKNFLLLFIATFSIFFLSADDHKANGMADIAKAMVSASYEGRDAFASMVEKHMAEDGYNYPDRFVGFGFYYNPQSENPNTITSTVEGSSAAAVMKVGDVVLSIDGESAWQDAEPGARKLGDMSSIVVLRDGEELKLDMALGVVNPRFVKSDWLDGINSVAAEDWGSNMIDHNVIEAVAGESSAYVLHWRKFTDTESGVEAEQYAVTRVGFNEDGMVNFVGVLEEEELYYRQTGWMITR